MIRIYNGLDPTTPARFGEKLAFEITGNQQKGIIVNTLIGDIEIGGNTKSPYLQGTRTSDREMLTEKTYSGKQETITIQDKNIINLLEDFFTYLSLYVPSTTTFDSIYVKNARGKEYIQAQDLHRQKMTLHGGINKVVVDIDEGFQNAEIEIQ